MNSTKTIFWTSPERLRVGIFVELDLGWLSHPFASSRFRISSQKQIDTIVGLKLKQVRCIQENSEPVAWLDLISAQLPVVGAIEADKPAAESIANPTEPETQPVSRWQREQDITEACSRHFKQALSAHKNVFEWAYETPLRAREVCYSAVGVICDELERSGDFSIRLLRDMPSDKVSTHSVNVTVLSLLLGRALGLGSQELQHLGMAAFIHDLGKCAVPERLRLLDDGFSPAEYKSYQSHVEYGVELAKAMSMPAEVATIIGQHHEYADGSGFPAHLKQEQVTLSARILALVNYYDRLCNPVRVGHTLTPHEALSTIFVQHKHRFDTLVLSSFIRMMGVYPPGSIVQLIDDRYAMVQSVNSSRPLKPTVVVQVKLSESANGGDPVEVIDLETTPRLGIKRSIKPSHLPKDAEKSLEPSNSIGYYFECLEETTS